MAEPRDARTYSDEELRALGVQVGEKLLGTCGSLIGMLEQMELDEGLQDRMPFCEGLDQTAMECTCCNWYVEPGEMDDDTRCEQCSEEEDDDD